MWRSSWWTTPTPVRLFIAISFPPSLRQAIASATAPMRRAASTVAWVSEERLHLTLKFLGEVDEDRVQPLADALRGVGRGHRRLSLRVGGLGAFPTLRQPRVIWMGVERESRLELLRHDIEAACDGLGYQVEGRAFRPHVTLGRARDGLAAEEARALATAARAISYGEMMDVHSIDLMASERVPDGPRYRVVAAAPLGED